MSTAPRPLSVAVIGAGTHTTDVILPSLAAAGLRAASVCARRIERAQAVADRFGVPIAHDDAERACADPVDGVMVAVPPDQFQPVLDVAIGSGRPLFVEKPGAATSEQARQLADQATANGVPVVVNYMKRAAPAYQRLHAAVHGGELGPPSLVHVRWSMGPFDTGRPLDDWLLENGVHAIDLARFVAGELTDLDAAVSGGPGEWVVLARARSTSGAAVSLQLCTTGPWWVDNEFIEVFGRGSSGRVENATAFVLRDSDGQEHRWAPNFTLPVGRNLTGELLGFVPSLRAFADVVAGRGESPCDLADAARTLAIAEEIVHGARA